MTSILSSLPSLTPFSFLSLPLSSLSVSVLYTLSVSAYNIFYGFYGLSWVRKLLKIMPSALLYIQTESKKSLFYGAGDLFLISDTESCFIAGMVSFLVGHLYSIYQTLTDPFVYMASSEIAGVAQYLFVMANIYMALMAKYTRELTIPVMVYAYVLILKVSVDTVNHKMLSGILFLIADALLGIEIFVPASVGSMDPSMVETTGSSTSQGTGKSTVVSNGSSMVTTTSQSPDRARKSRILKTVILNIYWLSIYLDSVGL